MGFFISQYYAILYLTLIVDIYCVSLSRAIHSYIETTKEPTLQTKQRSV